MFTQPLSKLPDTSLSPEEIEEIERAIEQEELDMSSCEIPRPEPLSFWQQVKFVLLFPLFFVIAKLVYNRK